MSNYLNFRLRNVFRLLGYEVIPEWRLGDFSLSQHLCQLFRALSIDCVFHVGANQGQYRDFLRFHVGYPDTIISFEPQQQCFEKLSERAKTDDLWFIYNYALGNRRANILHKVPPEL